MRKTISLSIAFLVIAISYAQDTSIITTSNPEKSIYHFSSTRPSFSEGILLVPSGKAQVELGVAYSYFSGGYHQIQHPAFLLKYGISKYFEFRINGDATTYKADGYASVTGFHPIFIGMKIKMIDAKKYAPGSSFIGGLSVNFISTKNFRTKYVAPYFKITMEQFLPKNVGLVYNYGLIWNGEDAKPTYNFAIATNYTHFLKSKEEKHHQIKYFFEVYGIYPHGEKIDVRVNTGFAYLLNKFLQFDVSVGAGLLKNSPRVITSAGLVIRFPKKDKVKEKKKK